MSAVTSTAAIFPLSGPARLVPSAATQVLEQTINDEFHQPADASQAASAPAL